MRGGVPQPAHEAEAEVAAIGGGITGLTATDWVAERPNRFARLFDPGPAGQHGIDALEGSPRAPGVQGTWCASTNG